MKNKTLFSLLALPGILSGTSALANSGTVEISILNNLNMPISPGVISTVPPAKFGEVASPGLIKLCQTGDPALLIKELKTTYPEQFVLQFGAAPTSPAGNVTVQFEASAVHGKDLYAVAMYGKTKDTCSYATIPADAVAAIAHGHVKVFATTDQALVTGAFQYPSINEEANRLCESESTAIGCLRGLSAIKDPVGKVSAFSAYLPSVLRYLEERYGSAEVQSLVFPSSGGVRFSAKKL